MYRGVLDGQGTLERPCVEVDDWLAVHSCLSDRQERCAHERGEGHQHLEELVNLV
jgi:hypothetical protein